MTVEGYDPNDGSTLWEVAVGPETAAAIIEERHRQPLSDGRTIVLPAAEGPVVVDVGTGETRPPAEDDVFACTSEAVKVVYAIAWMNGDEPITRRFGGRLVAACAADGSAREALTWAAVRAAGIAVDEGRVVLAREGVVEGYALA